MAVMSSTQPNASPPLVVQIRTYQRRIGWAQASRLLTGAGLGIGAGWTVAALVGTGTGAWPVVLLAGAAWSAGLLVAALLLAWRRWPTPAHTAAWLDAHLDNRQRVITALEVLHTPQPPALAQLHVQTTERLLAAHDPHRLVPAPTPGPALLMAAGLLGLALAVALLGASPAFAPLRAGALPPAAPRPGAVPSATAAAGLPPGALPPGLDDSILPGESSSAGSNPTGGGSQTIPTSAQDAAQQVVQARAAQAALQRLARALGEGSATQAIADSLRGGRYDEAARQLTEVGQQSDQLSDAAKRSLGNALDRAATDTTVPALREAEAKAARALAGGDYVETASALDALGQAVQQTAGTVVPQQELAKNFPTPDPAGSAAATPGAAGTPPAAGTPGTGQAGDPSGAEAGGTDAGQGSAGAAGTPGPGATAPAGGTPPGASPGEGTGEGDGSGGLPGDGSSVSGPADPGLNTTGNPFELDSRPDPARPGGSNTPPPALDPTGSAAAGAATTAGGDPALTVPGEDHRVPVEHWLAVERYFSPDTADR